MLGLNYGSIFTDICKLNRVHTVLAITVKYDLEFWQLDGFTVLPNTDVVRALYADMNPGFEYQMPRRERRLFINLYGLCLSPNGGKNDERLHRSD